MNNKKILIITSLFIISCSSNTMPQIIPDSDLEIRSGDQILQDSSLQDSSLTDLPSIIDMPLMQPKPITCKQISSYRLQGSPSTGKIIHTVRQDQTIGMLWAEEQTLYFTTFPIDNPIDFKTIQLIVLNDWNQIHVADLAVYGNAFIVVYMFGTIPSQSLQFQLIQNDNNMTTTSPTQIAENILYPLSVEIVNTESGHLIIAWSSSGDQETPGSIDYVMSADAKTFSPPKILFDNLAYKLRSNLVPGGFILAWLARAPADSRFVVNMARFNENVEISGHPSVLMDKISSIIDLDLAMAEKKLGIATIDTKDDVINPPLYFASVNIDSSIPTKNKRLTFQNEHKSVALAWSGIEFGYAFTKFIANEGSQIYLFQLDEEGNKYFDPIQISSATINEFGIQTSAENPNIVSDGKGGFFILWSELINKVNGKNQYTIKGVRLMCETSA